MALVRPSFAAAWNRFKEIHLPVAEVGRKIGGYVQVNIASGDFRNACPLRMSYVLNDCGLRVPPPGRYHAVSGSDHRWYMYRVMEMKDFLIWAFGPAEVRVSTPSAQGFFGRRGILLFEGDGWGNARGHVTLWSGRACADECHFVGHSGNGSFMPTQACLWELA
ncbi:T6SS effector amidase Tae4 family protein [Frateuria aurantia]|uniref:Type VI secretion system (T6SS), amidase effector protein 4 n=1 Tax=Frateuria aurantia (strain ATCC 33424 / DSM 6220 / KCTC 2777 / LMG 1558 / NBRC 3245 / NCIMB 13370) TaxID=767434 RepID=H8L0F9_FRAAD|nr:T6SS effector amidase Tae4 family protein [Frateuria aurantia]AFC87454.1 hypothetical protein Fraau_3129 [Frateuria aurantia DSM 6220]